MLFLVQLRNVKEEKEDASTLLIDDIIIDNSIRQGMNNETRIIPVTIYEAERAKVKIEAQVEVGNIVEEVLKYNIKSGTDQIITVKVPIIEDREKIESEYTIPKSLDLKNAYSMGLRRRLFLEQLKENANLQWVNMNYKL